jgi:hypothetical protein
VTVRVYFVRAGDFVKIGWARDVEKRVRALQVASALPLELLGVVPGCDDVERIIHAQFNALHVRGEWYRAEPALLDFIKRCADSPLRAAAAPYEAARADILIESLRAVVSESLREMSSGDEFGAARMRAVLTELHSDIATRLKWSRRASAGRGR